MSSSRLNLLSRLVFALGLVIALPGAGQGEDVLYLDQGLSAPERQRLYNLPQGSEIMPYDWFLALEQPLSEKSFRDSEFLSDLRFAPNPVSALNPDGLPVGFVRGKDEQGASWFGLTCAACHTTDLSYKGRRLRVDGGTTLADMIQFQQTVLDALRVTRADSAKFERFARRVLKQDYATKTADALADEVDKQVHEMMKWAATSRPFHATGFGTWDAVNILMNTITAGAINEPRNYRVPHVPVSFPSIWQTNQYDRLLWNASVHNVALRQVGEVIIVFGRAKVTPTASGPRFSSSADFRGLDELYGLVSQIKPPTWPAELFGPLDAKLVAAGEKIYQREGCAGCHASRPPYPQTAPNRYDKTFIKIQQIPLAEIGTDPLYAQHFVGRMATPGPLAPAFEGTALAGKSEIPAALLFLAILTQITQSELEDLKVPKEEYPRWLGYRELPTLPKTTEELQQLVNSLLGYRAAPLAGVWASAPYLHNASVPTLYDLLLPPEQRAKTFYLGNREYDPHKVGYQTAAFAGGFEYDTTRPGQRNIGHTYGTKISDDDRRALLEYLKSL